jgi:hypothetical protein
LNEQKGVSGKPVQENRFGKKRFNTNMIEESGQGTGPLKRLT